MLYLNCLPENLMGYSALHGEMSTGKLRPEAVKGDVVGVLIINEQALSITAKLTPTSHIPVAAGSYIFITTLKDMKALQLICTAPFSIPVTYFGYKED